VRHQGDSAGPSSRIPVKDSCPAVHGGGRQGYCGRYSGNRRRTGRGGHPGQSKPRGFSGPACSCVADRGRTRTRASAYRARDDC
jgi:hypothetical protein